MTMTCVAFFVQERARLLGFCLRWTSGNRADAEDLLSEAGVRGLAALRFGSAHVANPLAWWTTIIANLARDQRKTFRRLALFDTHGYGHQATHPGADLERQLRSRRDLRLVLASLEQLPSQQQAVLRLRCVGNSYSEIARELGVSTECARKTAQVARERLSRMTGSARKHALAGQAHTVSPVRDPRAA